MINKFYLNSLKRVGISEAGYANDKDDTGGETYAGFSIVNNPDLKMWDIIHNIIKSMGGLKTEADVDKLNKTLKVIPAVQDEIALAYKKRYWDPIQLDLLNSEELAHQIFDMAVNAGVPLAISLAYELVGLPKSTKYTSALGTKLKEYGVE